MNKALENITIIDLTQVLAGPTCTRLFSEMGANVIKIEPPGGGYERNKMGSSNDERLRYRYACINRNKKNVTLNLKTSNAKEIFFKLIEKGDVVVSNYSVGVMESFGLDYETVKKRNPRIVYCTISGFGQDGPYKDYPAYDSIIQAACGFFSINGFPDKPPCRVGVSIIDYFGGLFAALNIMFALHFKNLTGQGQMIDVSLYDVACQMNLDHLAPAIDKGKQLPRQGNRHPISCPSGIFTTKDGKYLFLTQQTEKQWQSMTKIIGRKGIAVWGLTERLEKHRDEVEEVVQDWVKTQTLEEALAILRREKLPCSPVNGILDILSDPQSISRGNFISVEDDLGIIDNVHGVAVKLSLTPGKVEWGYVKAGKHNEEVYGKMLGYTREQIAELEKEGII